MRSRVMPGSLVTMERRVPVRRLKSVDLPTLGRPTITRDGRFLVMDASRRRHCEICGNDVTFHCIALEERWETSLAYENQAFTLTLGLEAGMGFLVARLRLYKASSARASISSGRSPIS